MEADGEVSRCLGVLFKEAEILSGCVTEPNEFVVADDIKNLVENLRVKIFEAKQIFGRSKTLKDKGP